MIYLLFSYMVYQLSKYIFFVYHYVRYVLPYFLFTVFPVYARESTYALEAKFTKSIHI